MAYFMCIIEILQPCHPHNDKQGWPHIGHIRGFLQVLLWPQIDVFSGFHRKNVKNLLLLPFLYMHIYERYIYSLLVQQVSEISHWKTCQLLASESLERYSCSGCQLVQRNSQFSFPHPPLLALFGACDETQLKMNDLKTSSRIESKRFWYAATLVCVVQQLCFGISPPPLNHQVGLHWEWRS